MKDLVNEMNKIYDITTKCFGKIAISGENSLLISKRKKKSFNNTIFNLEWVKVKNIEKGDYIPSPIPQEVIDMEEKPIFEKKLMDRKSKKIPEKVKINTYFLRLSGYYIAEGHTKDREVTFSFNKKEKSYIEDVRRITKKIFGLETSVKTIENKTDVKINSSRISRTFKIWFNNGALNKKIPEFMMLLPKEKQKYLIKGMWRGDGWVDKEGKRASYKTISPILTEQLKQLLLRQNIVPTISTNKAYGMHKESYSIQVVSIHDLKNLLNILNIPIKLTKSKSIKPHIIRNEQYAYLPIRKIELVEVSR